MKKNIKKAKEEKNKTKGEKNEFHANGNKNESLGEAFVRNDLR